ncbi:MAG: CHAP domain-containing protein [Myxococcaceae bacterium]
MSLLKEKMLIQEAKRWVGITEQGGNNHGQLVELFQRTAGGLANGEPWCMSFAQYCIQEVDASVVHALVLGCPDKKSQLFKSEHCLTVWNKSQDLKIDTPRPGSLCIWQQGQTASGHVGIVVDVNADGSIMTVEGNTSRDLSAGALAQVEGDGVWLKRRCLDTNGSLRLKGFLRVW